MSGWGCPHESQGACVRLKQQCNPGMKGCILHGRFRFADPSKNRKRPAASGSGLDGVVALEAIDQDRDDPADQE